MNLNEFSKEIHENAVAHGCGMKNEASRRSLHFAILNFQKHWKNIGAATKCTAESVACTITVEADMLRTRRPYAAKSRKELL